MTKPRLPGQTCQGCGSPLPESASTVYCRPQCRQKKYEAQREAKRQRVAEREALEYAEKVVQRVVRAHLDRINRQATAADFYRAYITERMAAAKLGVGTAPSPWEVFDALQRDVFPLIDRIESLGRYVEADIRREMTRSLIPPL